MIKSMFSRGSPGAGSLRCESAMEGKDVAAAEAELFETVEWVSSTGSNRPSSCSICNDDVCMLVLSRFDFLRHLCAVR